MIHSLRQQHRRTFLALGIFLPVAFVVGIAARKSVPTVAELPAALAATPQKFEAVEWERADLFSKSPVQVRLLRKQKSSGQFAVSFSAAKDFVPPDLIVYWVTANSSVTNTLPANAILLGTFSAAALPLSDEIVKSNGALILYSLANGEIVEVSKPISLQTFNASNK